MNPLVSRAAEGAAVPGDATPPAHAALGSAVVGRGGAMPSFGMEAVVALLTAATMAAVFVVPFRVGAGAPIVSTSYLVGYSNRAALWIVVLGALALSLARVLSPATGDHARDVPGPRAYPSVRAAALGIAPCVIAILFVAVLTSADLSYAEASYFMRRLECVVAGEVPVRDFEYAYGPLLAYGPAALASWFKGAGALKWGYLAAMAGSSAAGLAMLALVVGTLGMGARASAVFVLLAVVTTPLLMGLNDSLLRFIAPFAIVAAMYQAGGSERLSARWRQVSVLVLASVGTGFCLLISPDTGMACVIGVVTYQASRLRGEGPRALPALLGTVTAVGGTTCIFAAFGGGKYLAAPLAYAGGAFNLPVLPSPATAIYLASLLWVVSTEGALFLRGRGSPVLVAFAALAMAFSPAALGRCDVAHLLLNGLGVYLLAFRRLAGLPGRRFAAYLAGFALVFGVAKVGSDLFLFRNSIGKHAVDRLADAFGPDRVSAWARLLDASGGLARQVDDRLRTVDFSTLNGYRSISAIKPDERLQHYLRASGRWHRLYNEDMDNLFLSSQVDAFVRGLRANPPDAIVLAEDDWPLQRAPVYRSVGDMTLLSVIAMTPTFWLRTGGSLGLVLAPLSDYLARNYRETGRQGHYVILRRSD